MSKFTFKLATLLRHREHVEKQKQIELSRVQSRLIQLKSQLAEVTAAQRDSSAAISRNPSALHEHQRFGVAMSRKALALRRELAATEAEHAAAHAAFASAAKDRKSIEILREKHLERWRQKQNVAEQHAMDDAAARGASEYHSA
jgi:flagellar export protein FliJ